MLSPKTQKQNETNEPVYLVSDITPREELFQESLQLYFVQKRKKKSKTAVNSLSVFSAHIVGGGIGTIILKPLLCTVSSNYVVLLKTSFGMGKKELPDQLDEVK